MVDVVKYEQESTIRRIQPVSNFHTCDGVILSIVAFRKAEFLSKAREPLGYLDLCFGGYPRDGIVELEGRVSIL